MGGDIIQDPAARAKLAGRFGILNGESKPGQSSCYFCQISLRFCHLALSVQDGLRAFQERLDRVYQYLKCSCGYRNP